METVTETPRPRRPFSKAKPRKELLAQIQRAQRIREMEGQRIHEEHVEIILPPEDSKPEPPPPRPRPFSKARPRKELLAQIQRAQQMRHEEQQENIPPVDPLAEELDKRTTFDKLVDRLDQEGRVPKSSHPRSALEAILNEEGREYNDSTIASLENIIHPVLDTPPHPRDNEAIHVDEEPPHTPKRHQSKEMEQEELALASLTKQLRTTQSTIKDANRGLRRISNRIEGTEAPAQIENPQPKVEEPEPNVKIEPPVEPAPKPEPVRKAESKRATDVRKPEPGPAPKDTAQSKTPQPPAVAQPKTAPRTEVASDITIVRQVDHNGRTICTHCGGRYASVWRALWVELRENFYIYDSNSRFYIVPTWLGWITGLFLIWLVIESSLCLTWCDNVDGPLMPFVTHYAVLYPLRPYLKPYWRFLGWIIDTIFNLENGQVPLSGYGVPVSTFTSAAVGATARATKRVAQSTMEAIDNFGSIWDDELV